MLPATLRHTTAVRGNIRKLTVLIWRLSYTKAVIALRIFGWYAKVRVIMFLTACGPKKDSPAAGSLIRPLTKVMGLKTI
jgi:hypothetical protein